MSATRAGVRSSERSKLSTTFLSSSLTPESILGQTIAPHAQMVAPILWHIARVMVEVEKVRFRYKYGTTEARIYRDVAVPKPTLKLRILDTVLMLVLFGAHLMYRKRLQSTRVNGMVYVPDFQGLMQSLVVEWAGEHFSPIKRMIPGLMPCFARRF